MFHLLFDYRILLGGVLKNLISVRDEMVLLCIDEGKLKSEVRYEDGDNCGSAYPHIYGLVNNYVVMQIIPFLKNEDATWIKNPEFADIQDK